MMSIGDEVLDAIIEVADEYVGFEGNVELKGERSEFVESINSMLGETGEVVEAEIDVLHTKLSLKVDRNELAMLQYHADAKQMPLTEYVKMAALRWGD